MQKRREGCRNPPAAEAIEIDRRQALRLEREHRAEGGRAAMARDDAADLSPGNILKAQVVRIDFHVVKADAFSEGAKAKIEALGGTCEVI